MDIVLAVLIFLIAARLGYLGVILTMWPDPILCTSAYESRLWCGSTGGRTERGGVRAKFGGEFCRCLVSDPAVQPLLIPVPLVLRSQNFRLQQRTENFPVRKLRLHPAVERFAVAVLPRTARGNIQRPNVPRSQPFPDRSRDELRPVVRTNRSGPSVPVFQPLQARHHVSCRHPPLHFQRQTFSCEFVHHRKPFQPSSVHRFVHREIPAPHVILILRLLHRAAVLAVASCSFSPLPQRVPQAFLAPQSLHPLLVDLHPFSPQ